MAPAAPPADWQRARAGPPVQTVGGAWRASSRAAALAVGARALIAPPPPAPRSPRAAPVRLRRASGAGRGGRGLGREGRVEGQLEGELEGRGPGWKEEES